MIRLFLIHLVFSAVCSFHFSPKTFTRSVARPLHSKGESLSDDEIHSSLKWQSALSSLRDRVSSIKSGVPAGASSLYSLMTEDTPTSMINAFVSESSPTVLNAMTDTINSMLGNIANNPQMGMDVTVEATGEKLAALCYQLQMTGYMFRNAEYVLALKRLMSIESHSIEEYKKAFNRIDTDSSGFIEASEIEGLLQEVYGGDSKLPGFEIDTFLKFFDENGDKKISWGEFEMGLGVVKSKGVGGGNEHVLMLEGGENNASPTTTAKLSGIIKVEMDNDNVVDVDANEYVAALKAEMAALKSALAKESDELAMSGEKIGLDGDNDEGLQQAGLGGYLMALPEDNVKALTKGISNDVIESMRMLINYVLDGGPANAGKLEKEEKVALPAGALRQLGLWQLVLGYRLRELEAKGEYKERAN